MIIERAPLRDPSSSRWHIMIRTINAISLEPIGDWHMVPGSYDSKRIVETEIGRMGGPSEMRKAS